MRTSYHIRTHGSTGPDAVARPFGFSTWAASPAAMHVRKQLTANPTIGRPAGSGGVSTG